MRPRVNFKIKRKVDVDNLQTGTLYKINEGFLQCEIGPTLGHGDTFRVLARVLHGNEVIYLAMSPRKGLIAFNVNELHDGLLEEVNE